MEKFTLVLSAICVVATLSVSQQVYAGKPISVVCGNGKIIEVDSSKNSLAMNARSCSKAGHPAPIQRSTASGAGALSSQGARSERQGLLLPAVQAVRESARTGGVSKRNLGSRSSNPAADTTCNGVNSCNDMIATCTALGGNVTPTSYEPGTGAPNGATCFPPGP
ncbi:MAG: hypothetical protein L3J84_07365 [Gammaproteobacteria bacterium]|nr:hypothetical protein [Gammaproteobacteria bacterium]